MCLGIPGKVVETYAEQADAAAAWLQAAMIDGMTPLLDPIPIGVELVVCRNWAGDPA